MMTGVREFLRTKGGTAAGIALVVVALAAVVWSISSNLGDSAAAVNARERVFVCAETKKPFNHELVRGESIPVKSPYTGKNTGYPAELCYWTADGGIKDEPTAVLMNTSIGLPGRTYCPDCKRQVVGFNPRAMPEMKPPPTEAGAGDGGGGSGQQE